MQLESDILGQFFKEGQDGDLTDDKTQVKFGPDEKIEKKKAWALFNHWQKNSIPMNRQITKMDFYSSMSRRGVKATKIGGYYHYYGFDGKFLSNVT
jgi:hypothetical protein